MSRTLTVYRATHAYTEIDYQGMRNIAQDKETICIYIDGKNQGKIKANETKEYELDENSHILKFGFLIPEGKYILPAGHDSFDAIYFNHSFSIGIVDDLFLEIFTNFVLGIFRGPSLRDRLLNPKNKEQSVELSIHSDYMSFTYPKFGTEKIDLKSVGIPLPNKEKLPTGYWNYVELKVFEAITNDEKAGMTKIGYGRFTLR